jgi:hypothetical protein
MTFTGDLRYPCNTNNPGQYTRYKMATSDEQNRLALHFIAVITSRPHHSCGLAILPSTGPHVHVVRHCTPQRAGTPHNVLYRVVIQVLRAIDVHMISTVFPFCLALLICLGQGMFRLSVSTILHPPSHHLLSPRMLQNINMNCFTVQYHNL